MKVIIQFLLLILILMGVVTLTSAQTLKQKQQADSLRIQIIRLQGAKILADSLAAEANQRVVRIQDRIDLLRTNLKSLQAPAKSKVRPKKISKPKSKSKAKKRSPKPEPGK